MIRLTTLAVSLAGRAGAAVSVFFLASASLTGPASADWLVSRDGQLIETLGPWWIEGRQVVFESRQIPVTGWISRSGTQFTVSIDQIDLARSARETEARSGVLLDLPRVAASRVPAAPRTMLQGWDDWGFVGRPPNRVELVLKLGGAAWDNFLQDPEINPRQEVAAGIAEGRLTWRLFGGVKGYVEAGHIGYDYEEVPSTTAYEAGLRVDGAYHGFQAGARLEPGRRAPELDDGAEVADIRKYRARYFGHGGAFDWSLGGERVEQRFEGGAGRESRAHRGRVALAYRGLHGRLAPEVGFAWALRDVTGEAEDERQRTLQFGLRSRPFSPLSMAVRFESMRRRFVVADPRARNFGREDTRRRWVLEGEVDLTRQLAFSLQYSLVDGESTRADRDFTAQSLAAGLTVTLGSTRRAVVRNPRRPHPMQPMIPRRTDAPRSVAPPVPPPAAAVDGSDVRPPSQPTATVTASRDRPTAGPVAAPSLPARPRAAAPALPAASSLLGLRARSVDGETTITLRGNGELRYTTLTLAAPHRFVVDLLGVVVGSPRTIAVAGDLVRRLRVAQFRPGPSPIGRVVFDLVVPASVEVERREDALLFRLRRAGG